MNGGSFVKFSKNIGIITTLLVVFFLSGCASGGNLDQVVKDYLQSDVEGRLDYVISSENIEEKMKKHYDGVNVIWTDEMIAENEFESEADGEKGTVTRTLKSNTQDRDIYSLRKVDNKWKINWEASVGYNEMNLVEFQAVRPSTPVELRLNIELDDYYNYELRNAQGEYYSLQVFEDQTQETFNVYIKKDTSDGKAIFEELKSGARKKITLTMYIPDYFKSGGNIALVDKIISLNWK